jgi:hypothetical protein
MTTGSSDIAALDNKSVPLFSDLLLHDMGSLGDGIAQSVAQMDEIKTAPLWGLRVRAPYLHDGRAPTVDAAIRAHDGEAAPARDRFIKLSPDLQSELTECATMRFGVTPKLFVAFFGDQRRDRARRRNFRADRRQDRLLQLRERTGRPKAFQSRRIARRRLPRARRLEVFAPDATAPLTVYQRCLELWKKCEVATCKR